MKNTKKTNTNIQENQSFQPDNEDDFFIDESLVNLLKILIPNLKWIFGISAVIALLVGLNLYFSPRQYECRAVVAPDVTRDLTSVDLVQLTSGDSDFQSIPLTSQMSQLETLATSSQIKKAIIETNSLMKIWECQEIRECINKLKNMYSVSEIRNVGLEITAKSENQNLPPKIVTSAIESINTHYEELIRQKAEKSIEKISGWIQDVTREINQVADEFIKFASKNNVSNFNAQLNAGSNLVATIKQNIILKESELAEKLQTFDETSDTILPIKAHIKDLKDKLENLLTGNDETYPPIKEYESLKLKVQEYENRLSILRNRLELFNKQLAAAQIETQRQTRSIMILDEPFTEPVGKGTIKFTMLTFIGFFFLLCILIILKSYVQKLRTMIS